MPSPSKSKGKIDLLGILGALKPLLFAIIPIVILIIINLFIAEHYPEVAKWIKYCAYIMFAIIGLWVFIRLAIYFNGVLRLWRHDREVMRQDPLFVIETKMRARLKDVHSKLRRSEKRIYDIPFYGLIGPNNDVIESLLAGSGIAFPKDLNELKKKEVYEGYEKWYVGNEAVFIDITSLQSPEKDKEWRIFLKVLSNIRPAAPLNGVLVVTTTVRLREEDSRQKKEIETSLQKNLQLMQEKLLEIFPVYLIIADLDKIIGFEEFFGSLEDNARGQMFGWSGKGNYKNAIYIDTLTEDIEKIKSRIEDFMLRRMVEQKNPQLVDLIYIFAKEFNFLLKRVVDFVGRVFDPNAYLEPVSLRGFYFFGCGSERRQSVLSDLAVDGQTVIGDGVNMRIDAPTILGDDSKLRSISGYRNWFCSDFIQKKMIPESGTICRPNWMVKRQSIIKFVAATTIIIQILFVVGLLVSEAGKTADWREESIKVIERAQILLGKETSSRQDEAAATRILEDILRIKEGLEKQGLFKSATSIGLGGEVTEKLLHLHSLIYQIHFIKPLIKKVEYDIDKWNGNEKEFVPFGEKLIEYLRWSNPKYYGELHIEPFLSREKDAISTRHRRFLLRHFLRKNTDEIPRMTDDKALARVSRALEKINGSSRVTIPLESGTKSRNPGESEWEWWQRLSGKLTGFSDTIQKFIKIESPFEERQEKDANDQIYYVTKMIGLMMSSILEMEGLIEEGKRKYPTWISSLPEFYSDMEKYSAEWPPMLEIVEKSEMRSEFAYDKIVVPLFNNDMAWVQTFIGVRKDVLTPILDRLVERKTNVGKRQIDIYREIGKQYLAFLKNFNNYLVGFGELIKKSGALVSYSTYYSGDELMKKLETVKKELSELTKLEIKTEEAASVLNSIKDEVEKKDNEKEDNLKAKDGVKKNLMKVGKSALEDAVSGIELKKQVLLKFYWMQISDWLKQWLPGLRSEKAYLASLYWMELFDWFKPFTKNEMKGGSYSSILRMNLFIQKNAQYFTEDIERFLDGWLTSVPVEITSVLAEEGAIQRNPGLKDFDTLYSQVKKFKDQYLPQLRQASTSFVSAVNLMEPDAQKTWKKLAEGSEAELNWDALESFTKFKNDYEIKEGIALRNITGSLEEVQVALSKTLNGELGRKFEDAWNVVLKKIRLKDTDTKFPFVQDGPSASKTEAMDAISEFVDLGVSLGIIKSEDGTSIELTGQSQKIMDRIVPTVRRKFLEKCAIYKSFLGGEGDQMPEIVVELVPGEIGKHYHWIRLFVGRLRYYDLSVYGDKKVTIDLASATGGIKFMGLDVEKSGQAEQTVTKGDLGILQITYQSGRSIDKEKTKWRVSGSLASASSDGEQVPFELIFTFNKPVPPLPILPG